VDPSVETSTGATTKLVGVLPDSKEGGGELKTVFESVPLRPKDKRKRQRNDNPEDIEGFVGPWGRFENEMTVAKPSEVSHRLFRRLMTD